MAQGSMAQGSMAQGSMAQYDAFAEFYNRNWGVEYHAQLEGVLDRLLLPHLSSGNSILDVGCGSGQVVALLSSRGFRVTGVDESEAMLALARLNAPAATFIQGDARTFRLKPPATASIATFEALNNILDPVDLERALTAMAESTSRISVFDLLAEVAYNVFWNGIGTVEQGAEVCNLSLTSTSSCASQPAAYRLEGARLRSGNGVMTSTSSIGCYAIGSVTSASSASMGCASLG
jgi:SAM-dependent methyltransferase